MMERFFSRSICIQTACLVAPLKQQVVSGAVLLILRTRHLVLWLLLVVGALSGARPILAYTRTQQLPLHGYDLRLNWYVIAFLVGLVVEGLLIAWLLISHLHRRGAELENRQIAGARRLSEQRSKAIQETAPDLIFLQTLDGVYLDCQARDHGDLILPPEEFLGKNMRDVLPSKLAEVFADCFEKARLGEMQTIEYELEINQTRRRFRARILLAGQKILTLVRDISSRKLPQLDLAQNETQLAEVISFAGDSLITVDESDRIILFNSASEKLFLCSAAEMLGEPCERLIPERCRNAYRQYISTLVDTTLAQREKPHELLALSTSGEELPVQATVSLVDRQGQEFRTFIISDIEGGRTSSELRMSEEEFGHWFQANPQPMSLITLASGVYRDVNNNFLQTSGYTREELIGHKSLELLSWEQRPTGDSILQPLHLKGPLVNLATEFCTRNGSERSLLSVAEKVVISGEDCMLVTSTDLTGRVVSRRAPRKTEEVFKRMADSSPVMIWVSGDDKAGTYFNKQWLEFTGRSEEEELGYGWAQNLHPDDYTSCLETYDRNFAERKPFGMEYRLRRKDGVYRWIFDAGTPRFSPDQVFLGYIGSCIDITERKEAELKLHQGHEEALELENQFELRSSSTQEEHQGEIQLGEMVGQSDAIKYVLLHISQVAPTDSTVLILGDTGTGKELVARAIHRASARKDKPLIKVNCGALSPTLIESELFGYEKGAFTGAGARKLGRFELASGGTIFLDEIGELPMESQVKILRVIQENEFERLGGTKTIKSDIRVIAATNRNLKLEVESGNFREDLWYRLNVYPITVPPLRQRKEDIPLLVEYFVNRFAIKFGKTITSVSPQSIDSLRSHSWPGNVRELANVVERAVIYTQGAVLQVRDRLEQLSEKTPAAKTLEEVEREYIIRILEDTGWRIEGPYGAARILNLNPSTLRTRMVKLGIHRRAHAYE